MVTDHWSGDCLARWLGGQVTRHTRRKGLWSVKSCTASRNEVQKHRNQFKKPRPMPAAGNTMPNSRQTQNAKARQSAKRKKTKNKNHPQARRNPPAGDTGGRPTKPPGPTKPQQRRQRQHAARQASEAAPTKTKRRRTGGEGSPGHQQRKRHPRQGGEQKGTQQNSKPGGSRTAKPATAPPQPGEAHEPRSTARAATQARHPHADRPQQLSCRRWPARSAAGPKPHSLPWEHDAG